MRHGLAVYDNSGEPERHDSGGDGGELDRPIPTVPPTSSPVLMGDDLEAIVLQLVQPLGTFAASTG